MHSNEEIHEAIDRFESVEWLDQKFKVDFDLVRQVVDRLLRSEEIDRPYADTILRVIDRSRSLDVRAFAYNLGAETVLWLAGASSAIGVDATIYDALERRLGDSFTMKVSAKRKRRKRQVMTLPKPPAPKAR